MKIVSYYTNKKLSLRFHTAQNDIAKVVILYGDPYWQELDQHQQYRLSYLRKLMSQLGTGQVADHWGVTLEAPYQRLQHLFEVTGQDGSKWLFGDRELRKDTESARIDTGNYFRVPYFHEIDWVKTPDWVKETVWYQIFPERFANGDSHK